MDGSAQKMNASFTRTNRGVARAGQNGRGAREIFCVAAFRSLDVRVRLSYRPRLNFRAAGPRKQQARKRGEVFQKTSRADGMPQRRNAASNKPT